MTIHGTAHAARDVRDMMAPLYFGRLWRPLLLDLALMRRPGLLRHPRVIHPLRLRLEWGGGGRNEKASKTGANLQENRIMELPQEANTYT